MTIYVWGAIAVVILTLAALIRRYERLITCVCLMGEGRNFRE